jgi:hypothetical protein
MWDYLRLQVAIGPALKGSNVMGLSEVTRAMLWCQTPVRIGDNVPVVTLCTDHCEVPVPEHYRLALLQKVAADGAMSARVPQTRKRL